MGQVEISAYGGVHLQSEGFNAGGSFNFTTLFLIGAYGGVGLTTGYYANVRVVGRDAQNFRAPRDNLSLVPLLVTVEGRYPFERFIPYFGLGLGKYVWFSSSRDTAGGPTLRAAPSGFGFYAGIGFRPSERVALSIEYAQHVYILNGMHTALGPGMRLKVAIGKFKPVKKPPQTID
jgi:opacity protein-like surface antigen